MKDSDKIVKIKKEIKLLQLDLDNSSAGLGEALYDADIVLTDSNLIFEIDELEAIIPQIKKKMETLQGYNLTIAESKDSIEECSEKIKELELHMDSLFEKIGVELYCFIGEKELAFSGIKGIYSDLKEGEHISERLENRLYSLEKSVAKKSLLDKISTPIKITRIKKDIEKRNRESLNGFKKLGRSYSQIPQLIDEETNESLLDILEEYKKLERSLRHQTEKQHSLNVRIEENLTKIKDGSEGLKLKILYSRLEQDIIDNQNLITVKLKELGYLISEQDGFSIDSLEVNTKIEMFNKLNRELATKNRELTYYEKRETFTSKEREIRERLKNIGREEEHIAICTKELEIHKSELSDIQSSAKQLKSWLDSNSLDS